MDFVCTSHRNSEAKISVRLVMLLPSSGFIYMQLHHYSGINNASGYTECIYYAISSSKWKISFIFTFLWVFSLNGFVPVSIILHNALEANNTFSIMFDNE